LTPYLETQAELLKLARVLACDPAELAFLRAAAPEELRRLRASVAERLLTSHRDRFERAVALSGYLPDGVVARLTTHAIGPQLAARAASLLSAEQISDFARRLPADFLADVAATVDLRTVGPLVTGIETAKAVAVTRVLLERGEWVIIGAFVGRVGDDVLTETIDLFEADALLRIGFVLEDRSRLDEIFARLGDDRVRELLVVAEQRDLLAEALHLVNGLDDDGVARIGRLLGGLEPARQDALVARLLADRQLRFEARRLLEHSPPEVHAAISRAG
jgi:hypothetical protein